MKEKSREYYDELPNWKTTLKFLRHRIGEKKMGIIEKYKLSEKDTIKLLGVDSTDILQCMRHYTFFNDSTYRTWSITHQ